MKFLDFIYYYLNLYFTNRPQTLTWSSAEERAAYALSLITTSWIMALEFIVFIHFFKDIDTIYLSINVPIGLGLITLYKYIYITRNRLSLLRTSGFHLFNLSDSLCIAFAWIILMISFTLPFAILVSNMK